MKLKLNPFAGGTLLDLDFTHAINSILERAPISSSDGIILTFTPNNQSSGCNNLSPMELAIDPAGNMQYFILYSKSVSRRVIEASWHFTEGTFTQFDESVTDVIAGRSLLQLVTRNLSAQLNAGSYQIDTALLFDRPKTAQSP